MTPLEQACKEWLDARTECLDTPLGQRMNIKRLADAEFTLTEEARKIRNDHNDTGED